MGSPRLQGSLPGWPHLGSRCWPNAASCQSHIAGSRRQKNCREIKRLHHSREPKTPCFGNYWKIGVMRKKERGRLKPFLICSCQIQHGHLYVCLCVHIFKVELYIAPAHPALFACCWAGCLGLLKQSGSTEWEGQKGIEFSIGEKPEKMCSDWGNPAWNNVSVTHTNISISGYYFEYILWVLFHLHPFPRIFQPYNVCMNLPSLKCNTHSK